MISSPIADEQNCTQVAFIVYVTEYDGAIKKNGLLKKRKKTFFFYFMVSATYCK